MKNYHLYMTAGNGLNSLVVKAQSFDVAFNYLRFFIKTEIVAMYPTTCTALNYIEDCNEK